MERYTNHANTNQKQTDKADFRTRKIIRDKEGHYVVIKGSVLQKDVTLFNAPNNRASKYLRQKLQGDIHKSTIIVGDFSISVTDRANKHTISKNIVDLNSTITTSSNWHLQNTPSNSRRTHVLLKLTRNRTFTNVDYILGHKTNLNKFKRV